MNEADQKHEYHKHPKLIGEICVCGEPKEHPVHSADEEPVQGELLQIEDEPSDFMIESVGGYTRIFFAVPDKVDRITVLRAAAEFWEKVKSKQ